jgi:assimilatory nitrate reductase catalytic subunit
LFSFTSPEEIWNEHRESTRGRDLDITGLSYSMLEADGPQHWPFPSGATQGKQRLYEDGAFETPNRRARFYVERYKPVAEPVDARFPLRLTTGRLRDQWHGMSRTGTVASLFGHVPEPRLSMNASDMARRGVHEGDLVRVDSRRGSLHVIAQADESIRSGQVYLPMHWGKRFLGGARSSGVNTVTLSAFDPFSRQPELKHAAVKVSAVDLPWRVVAFAQIEPAATAATLEAFERLQPGVTFASAVLIGRDQPGVLMRAAHDATPGLEWLDKLDRLLGLERDDVLRYDDLRRGHSRRIRIVEDRLLAARLSGEASAVASGEWLREWLVGARPVAEVRRLLLSPATLAPSGFVLSGRVVCQCFNVTELEIEAALAECEGEPRERIDALGARLKCGTNCGSCIPELRALASRVGAKARSLAA